VRTNASNVAIAETVDRRGHQVSTSQELQGAVVEAATRRRTPFRRRLESLRPSKKLATATDTVNGRKFWEIVDDTQTANWQNIGNTQSAGWTTIPTT
jgi:hypothetical protein